MEVILLRDVEKVGLRGEVVSVARGYARNFLLPRGLAEEATKARVAELQKRESQRARHEAKTADDASAIADKLGEARAALRGEGRPDRLPLRLGDTDRHRRRALEDGEGARRPPEDRRRQHQADRPLRGADRALPGRSRRRQDGRRPGRRRAALRGASSRRWRLPRSRRPSPPSRCTRGRRIEELLLEEEPAPAEEPVRGGSRARLARRRRRGAPPAVRVVRPGRVPRPGRCLFLAQGCGLAAAVPAESGRTVHSPRRPTLLRACLSPANGAKRPVHNRRVTR